jgi:hypothetical protein
MTSSSKTSSAVNALTKAILVNRLIAAIKLAHPGLGLAVDVGSKINSAVSLAKAVKAKLDKAKKEYGKAAATVVNSNMNVDTNQGYSDYAKLGSTTGGGGAEQNLHEHGLW